MQGCMVQEWGEGGCKAARDLHLLLFFFFFKQKWPSYLSVPSLLLKGE